MKRPFLCFVVIFYFLSSCTESGNNKSTLFDKHFSLSQAVVFIHLQDDNRRIELKNCDSLSYFEGASLSKTIYNIGLNNELEKLNSAQKHALLLMINHANGVENKSDCKFKYSDSSYIMAADSVQRWLGLSVEDVVPEGYRFVYGEDMTVLEGFVTSEKLARTYKTDSVALPNGTAYLNTVDAKKLLHSTKDYISKASVQNYELKICDYNTLYWKNGMGMDSSLGRPIYFQWGSNWCYNHLILVDITKNESFLIMTNSVIGASEIAKYFTEHYRKRLELFDFIKWY